MKKFLALLLVLVMAVSVFACGKKEEEKPTDSTPVESQGSDTEEENTDEATGDVMTYAEYVAAEVDAPVVVECYVQAHQSWWEDKVTVYAADQDGAYFIYEMACTEEDAAKLTAGTKIKVTGFKTEWSGEKEIASGATFEFVEGADTYVAEAKDLTDKLDAEDLIDYQNQTVAFKGLTVVASDDKDSAFLYKWDGSGAQGDDLYFKVALGEKEYTFMVESYLCDKDSDVYKAVEGLKVGDKIDVEGFLYWYEGAQPHVTSVTVAE